MSTDCTDLVSISELHRRLTADGVTINRSTLSRYVTRYADALNPVSQGRDTLVSYSAFVRHRAENINLPAGATPARSYEEPRRNAAAKARKEEADAALREIELAKARNQLTSTAQVAEAAREAMTALSAAFDLAVADCAERLAAQPSHDPRTIRPHLRKLKEAALDAFRRTLTTALEAGESEAARADAA
ncbi:hypothetical protein [Methylobacterium nodulans]|uniref:Uncharacterized protein n=1 Tax=Methylobacterium nodulans (strain LMG 21967 / CNCM I-2342 / ORS 2060) TaxID=460265 RepID=B8IDR4_METNO|nr:hypothetical protein [Methylobacterium nodulans]ACL55636.1 conserved hypothetical protein [Methylobacterium nodulans ORS 2060]